VIRVNIYKSLIKLVSGLHLSKFTKNVLKLFTSTAASGIITVITLPIITRLYDLEDLGNYQLLLSIIVIFGVIGSLKLEMAIVLPKEDDIAEKIVTISIIFLIIVTGFIAGLFYLYDDAILKMLDAQQLSQIIFLIPLGVFCFGLLEIFKYVLIRYERFTIFAKTRVYQVGSTQSVAIIFGSLKPDFVALFFSYILGFIISIYFVIKKGAIKFSTFSLSGLLKTLAKYKKIPLINTPTGLLNTLSIELPVFLFSYYFSPDVIGLYMLANRIVVMPMSFIGTSVSKVYFQTATQAYHNSPEALLKVYKNTVKKLSIIGIAPFLIIIVLAPSLTKFIFGPEWQEAGRIMQIISFGIYFRFISSPISSTFIIIDKQEFSLIIVIVSFLLRYLAMVAFKDSVMGMLIALSVTTMAFYICYNLVAFALIKKKISHHN